MPLEAPAGLPQAIRPDWPAHNRVTALMSTRAGGVSAPPFDRLNLRPSALGGEGTDRPADVAENQRRFAAALGAEPVWLNQVHGADVVELGVHHLLPGAALPRADASVCALPGMACTVLVADCLPVLLCSANGRAVGAAHAGWRGLAGGVLSNSVRALCELAGCAPPEVLAWLGPCIGPTAFEVGDDVLQAFGADPADRQHPHFAFRPRSDGSPRWRADLVGLARAQLQALGVAQVSGGGWCTHTDSDQFFSFRRQARTGRLAAGVALRPA